MVQFFQRRERSHPRKDHVVFYLRKLRTHATELRPYDQALVQVFVGHFLESKIVMVDKQFMLSKYLRLGIWFDWSIREFFLHSEFLFMAKFYVHLKMLQVKSGKILIQAIPLIHSRPFLIVVTFPIRSVIGDCWSKWLFSFSFRFISKLKFVTQCWILIRPDGFLHPFLVLNIAVLITYGTSHTPYTKNLLKKLL